MTSTRTLLATHLSALAVGALLAGVWAYPRGGPPCPECECPPPPSVAGVEVIAEAIAEDLAEDVADIEAATVPELVARLNRRPVPPRHSDTPAAPRDAPAVCVGAYALSAGEPSPCTGVLVSEALVRHSERIEVECAAQERLHRVEAARLSTALDQETRARLEALSALVVAEDDLARTQSRLRRRGPLAVAGTAAATAGIFAGTAWVIGKVQP